MLFSYAVPTHAQLISKPELTESQIDWLKEHPNIRLGVDPGYAPYSFVNEKGQFRGVAADFVKIINHQLGINMQMLPLKNWADIMAAAENKNIDVIATASQTPQRESFLHFSQLYIPTPLVILTRNSSTISEPSQLQDQRIALVKGYSASERVQKQIPTMKPIWVDSPLAALQKLSLGEADAHIGVLGVSTYLASQHGITNIKVSADFDIALNGQHFAIRKDWPELAVILDKALDAIPKPEKAAIFNRWLPIQQDTAKDAQVRLTLAEQKWVRDNDIIRIAVIGGEPPLQFIKPNGIYSGLASEYINLLHQNNGLLFQTVRYDSLANAISALGKDNGVDMLSSDNHLVQQDPNHMTTDAYLNSHLMIMTPVNSQYIGNIYDLKGLTIGVKNQSSAEAITSSIQDQTQVVTLPSTKTVLDNLEDNEFDAAIVDAAIGIHFLERDQHNGIKISATIVNHQVEHRFIVRKDWPLLKTIINKQITATNSDNAAAIRNKWFNPSTDDAALLIRIGWTVATLSIFVLLGYIVFYIRNRSLSKELKQQKIRGTELQQAQQHKRQFLAYMSHELRTPVNAVMGLSHLMQQTSLDTTQRDLLEKISFATNSMHTIVNDVLDFSKIEAGYLVIENEYFNLQNAIEEIKEILEIKAKEKYLDLTFKLPQETPVNLRGDVGRLKQVLTNLIANAIKFTEHGQVVLSISVIEQTPSDLKLKFNITDTGIGIDEQEIGTLFNAFVQGKNAHGQKFTGTGLGLVISQQLTQLMGGTLEVESIIGKGSHFYFTLSFTINNNKTKHKNQQSYNEKLSFKQKKLLIVEDNSITRQMLTQLMQSIGFNATSASNFDETIEQAKREKFDLILMDIQIPGGNGFIATRSIRADSKNSKTPVIALSAQSLPTDKDMCFVAGMDDYISKPVEPNVLFEVIARWVKADEYQASKEQLKLSIDIKEGIARCGGNQKLYYTLLKDFVEDHGDSVTDINKALDRGDFQQARKICHELRGVTSNLGAHEVCQSARLLEHELEQGIYQSNHTLEQLSLQLNTLCKQVLDLLNEQTPLKTEHSKKTSKNIDPELGLELIVPKLIRLLKHGDTQIINRYAELAPILETCGLDIISQQIQNHLLEFEFEAALRLMEEIALNRNIGIDSE